MKTRKFAFKMMNVCSWWRNCPTNAGPLTQHNIFLLLSDSMDRSAGIGFRCAVDATPTNCTTPWVTPGGPCPSTGDRGGEMSL